MSSLPPIPTHAPAIPLTPDVRAAYQALYDTYEDAIEATDDPGLETTLLASQSAVDDILTKDDMYRLHADTALFQALTQQIHSTNNDLKALQAQIAAISSKVALGATIITAITKVLTLVG